MRLSSLGWWWRARRRSGSRVCSGSRGAAQGLVRWSNGRWGKARSGRSAWHGRHGVSDRERAEALRGLKRGQRPAAVGTDKAGGSGPAVAALRKEGLPAKHAQRRQVRSLNTVVGADPGKLKGLIRPALGFQSLRTAHATLQGFEAVRALRKRQGSLLRCPPGAAGEVGLAHRTPGLARSAAARPRDPACPRSGVAAEPSLLP